MSAVGVRLVDAHLHLWDTRRMDYPWLAELPPLRRPFGPQDLDPDGHELIGAVFIEAGRRDSQALDEVAWVAGIAADWPVVQAIVAHSPLERGTEVAGQLRRLAEVPLVHGVRRNIQDEPAGFALTEPFVTGTRLLAGYGLTADLCVRHQQLPEVVELVTRVPEVTFVLDHLAKPAIGADAGPWREQLARLAARPNVVCKLSGLTTEADWRGWQPAELLPYLRHALAEFGADRCLFGSDWPVATLATGYGRWVDVVLAALADLAPVERDQVLSGTATRVYRLSDPGH